MCGRLKRDKSETIIRELGVDEFREIPRYNIGPMQFVEVFRRNVNGKRELVPMKWGLHGSAGMINARAETIGEKKAYKHALACQRCVSPVNGFYEWQRAPHQGYLVSMADDSPFLLGGLWAEWMTNINVDLTFAIITTAANELISTFHDRMPVILDRDAVDEWLAPTPLSPERLRTLFGPWPASKMKKTAVGTYVNNARNEGPRCVEPLRGMVSLFD